MSSIKNKVQDYLKKDRSFNNGRQLYNSLIGHNRAYARRLSALTESDENTKTLFYELGKLAGLDERVINSISSTALVSSEAVVTKEQEGTVDILKEQVESIAYPKLKSLVSELNLEVTDQKKLSLQAAYLEYLRLMSNQESEQKKSN